MVKLYLHCGYHKTGSSFLQTMFAQNRNYLLENGIYFPLSKDDKNMLKGNISPGNGIELVEAIRLMNDDLILDLLKKWNKDSVDNNCDAVLLSSEGFFHVLAESNFMELFTNNCNKIGFTDIFGLLFFRDPISHVFSVYKHRGKTGKIHNYKNWLTSSYETMDLTSNFLNKYKDFNIAWTFRNYSSDSKRMANIAFSDFLGINVPTIPEKERINISLTLSEIILIREIENYIPTEYITEIHSALSKLPISKKANDQSLKDYYTEITYKELKKYEYLIESVNKLLPFDEQLQFKEPEKNVIVENEVISITKHQFKIIFDLVRNNNNFFAKSIFYIKLLLRKIKRKIKNIYFQHSTINN